MLDSNYVCRPGNRGARQETAVLDSNHVSCPGNRGASHIVTDATWIGPQSSRRSVVVFPTLGIVKAPWARILVSSCPTNEQQSECDSNNPYPEVKMKELRRNEGACQNEN
jgi:hypothetical protein